MVSQLKVVEDEAKIVSILAKMKYMMVIVRYMKGKKDDKMMLLIMIMCIKNTDRIVDVNLKTNKIEKSWN